MRDAKEATGTDWTPQDDRRSEEDITLPIRIICSQAGGSRNARMSWLKKKGKPASRRTPDWTEIGEPVG